MQTGILLRCNGIFNIIVHMVKIQVATIKDSMYKEWRLLDVSHFGREVNWKVKKFKFKAVVDNKIVGMVEGKYESGIIYIDTIITAKSFRGKGIGKALIDKVTQYGKKMKAHKIWLMTGKHWSENSFYQKLGFELSATLPDFYFHQDFVIYTKEIK